MNRVTLLNKGVPGSLVSESQLLWPHKTCPLVSRSIVCRRLTCRTFVLGVILHEGGVTELQVQKPRLIRKGFRQASGKAGQFCFLCVPDLSSYEWHPFSLTSGIHFPSFIPSPVKTIHRNTCTLSEAYLTRKMCLSTVRFTCPADTWHLRHATHSFYWLSLKES